MLALVVRDAKGVEGAPVAGVLLVSHLPELARAMTIRAPEVSATATAAPIRATSAPRQVP